eukprot:6187545-Pleurochrysis_carterae.AAC.2
MAYEYCRSPSRRGQLASKFASEVSLGLKPGRGEKERGSGSSRQSACYIVRTSGIRSRARGLVHTGSSTAITLASSSTPSSI